MHLPKQESGTHSVDIRFEALVGYGAQKNEALISSGRRYSKS